MNTNLTDPIQEWREERGLLGRPRTEAQLLRLDDLIRCTIGVLEDGVAMRQPRPEVAAAWRCAVADVVAMIDREIRPLRMSRRKAEREIGERLDVELGAIFDWSRKQSPGNYREAFDVGLAKLRAAISPVLPEPPGNPGDGGGSGSGSG